MNARHQQLTYEPVSYAEWSYVMTPEDFAGGCFIRTNAHNGKQVGTGRNGFGAIVPLPLGVPLCKRCDGEIVDHVCHDCEFVFVEPLTECLSDPLPELEP